MEAQVLRHRIRLSSAASLSSCMTALHASYSRARPSGAASRASQYPAEDEDERCPGSALDDLLILASASSVAVRSGQASRLETTEPRYLELSARLVRDLPAPDRPQAFSHKHPHRGHRCASTCSVPRLAGRNCPPMSLGTPLVRAALPAVHREKSVAPQRVPAVKSLLTVIHLAVCVQRRAVAWVYAT